MCVMTFDRIYNYKKKLYFNRHESNASIFLASIYITSHVGVAYDIPYAEWKEMNYLEIQISS